MQTALNEKGVKILATKTAVGICEICRSPVMPKCGRIKIHHWSHHKGQECDTYWEPETLWHRQMKLQFDLNEVEVVIGCHRADIYCKDRVIELQNSTLSPDEIEEREAYYRNLFWYVNGAPFAEHIFFLKCLRSNVLTFKWKHARKCWQFAQRPVFIDFGDRDMASMFGAKETIFGSYFDQDGDEQSSSKTQIVRYRGPVKSEEDTIGSGYYYHPDDSLESVPAQFRSRTVLLLGALHDNGFGWGKAVDKEKLWRWFGASRSAG